MTFTPSIQSLYSTHSQTGGTSYHSAIDWTQNQIFICNNGADGNQYMTCLGILDSSEVQYALTTTGIGNVFGSPIAITPANVYTPKSLVGGAWKFDRTSLAQLTSGGTFSCFTGSFAPILCMDNTYKILATGPGFTASFYENFAVIDASTLAVWTPGAISYSNTFGYACAGLSGTGIGYVISSKNGSAGDMRLFSVNANTASSSYTAVGTIAASAIDATWTTVQLLGVCLDQTDGNLIVGVGNGSAYYIAKIAVADASVVWKSACDAAPALGDQMSQSTVLNQQFGYLMELGGGTNKFVLLNTNDGSTNTSYTTNLGGLIIYGSNCYSDTLGCIIGHFAYTAGAGTPTQLNSTPSSFDSWAALYVATAIPAPPGPGEPGGPATSRKRAWTYVLDGHTFYVLDLGAEGTFVYDTTTGSWAEYYTDQYQQWDVANGCMWGNRIVGGDLAAAKVWEVLGSTLTDNDAAYDISHLVTGGLLTRTRTYSSLAALRLSISNGALDDVAGGVIRMRFSDDQGNTWSDYFTQSLAEADYSTEVLFTSLGSFNAPGRVFEISDTGGPLRVDGCDAFLDDFDKDDPTGGGGQ